MATKSLLKSLKAIKQSVKSLSDPSKGKGLKQAAELARKKKKKKK